MQSMEQQMQAQNNAVLSFLILRYMATGIFMTWVTIWVMPWVLEIVRTIWS